MTHSADDKSLEQLVRQIDPLYKLLRSWRLNGGLSAQVMALEVSLPDGQTKRMIVRRPNASVLQSNPRAAAEGFKLLQLLHSEGLVSPTPYYLDEAGNTLIIEYIEGQPDLSPADLTDFTRQLATHLARIHSIDSSNPALAFLPTQSTQVGDQPGNVDSDSDEGSIRAALASIGLVPPLNKTALLHGDYWPGNVLWRDSKLVAVLDWEAAKLGDPLADLAVSRQDILFVCGIEAMNALTEHYKSLSTIDFTNLAYWDLRAALRATPYLADWATSYPPLGRNDITETTMREGLRLFVAQALDKLSIRCDKVHCGFAS